MGDQYFYGGLHSTYDGFKTRNNYYYIYINYISMV